MLCLCPRTPAQSCACVFAHLHNAVLVSSHTCIMLCLCPRTPAQCCACVLAHLHNAVLVSSHTCIMLCLCLRTPAQCCACVLAHLYDVQAQGKQKTCRFLPEPHLVIPRLLVRNTPCWECSKGSGTNRVSILGTRLYRSYLLVKRLL
jgi:hypothetical protein